MLAEFSIYPLQTQHMSKDVARRWCDDAVCLLAPEEFWAIGQFYEDFTQVEDEEVVALLREFAALPRPVDSQQGSVGGVLT